MASRKKAQGKARKAAKEAKAEEVAASQSQLGAKKLICNHGFRPELYPSMRICGEFVDAFIDAYRESIRADAKRDMITALNAARQATKKYVSVLGDVSKLEWIMSYFVAKGTRQILGTQQGGVDMVHNFAMLANHFEQTIAVIKGNQLEIIPTKLAELLNGDMKTVIKYLRKQIPCNCLDEKYEEVKSITKMGYCCNPECALPGRTVERKTMLYCTLCGEANYCSPDCQKVHWPTHKDGCRNYAEGKAKLDPKKK